MLPIRKVVSILTMFAFLFQSASQFALAVPQQDPPPYPLASKDAIQQRCDELAASPSDSARTGPGVPMEQINVGEALPACQQAATRVAYRTHYQFLYGRVLEAAQRYEEAAQQYRLAAQVAEPLAAINLGFLYQEGRGVPKDWNQAAEWFPRASRFVGHPD